MSRPSKFGRAGHSFDSETSVFTTPPLSPRASQLANTQLVTYIGAAPAGTAVHSDSAPRPTYYVQSPSRDSFTFNEGDSLSQSFAAKSTPSGSPLASPLHKSFASKPHLHQHHPQHQYQHHPQHQYQHHPQNQYQHHPQNQYQHHPQNQYQHHLQNQHQHQPQNQYQHHQAAYGNPRPGSRRVLPQPNHVAAGDVPPAVTAAHKKGYQPWNGGGTIQEEEEHNLPSGRRGVSRWCALFLSIVFALLCIVIVGLIYWLVCRPSTPRVEVKNITFQTFTIDEGNDPTGVPTQVLTANVSTILSFVNPSKYFGFHVSAPDVTLSYQQINVAEGEAKKFFQKKRSSGTISVDVSATRQPVYGAGPNLLSTFSSGQGLPLQLHIRVRSEARVIWKIVQPKYRSSISCDLVLDTTSQQEKLKILSQNCHRG